MKVANKKSMPNVVAGSMVLAGLICSLPAVTITPEMALLIFSSGYNIKIYFNCIWGGVGNWQLSQLKSFTGKAVVQVTEYSYTNVQAADSLTFMNTGQI